MGYENFKRTGVFTNGIKVDELIENLKEYRKFYGNQPVRFAVHGDEDCFVQFDYYENALMIHTEEAELK